MKQSPLFLALTFALVFLRACLAEDPEPASGFGKTHFIVGSQKVTVEKKKNSIKVATQAADIPLSSSLSFSCKPDGSLCQVFFSPDDSVRDKLIQLIDAEKESISIAVFTFTDKYIAQALMKAVSRGVKLALIVDPVCIRDRYNKVGMLCDYNVCTYVYNAQRAKEGINSSMHHKFALFSKTIFDKKLVWTGSFNFTKSATLSNQENVIVLDDPQIVAQFERQFNRLQESSYRYKAHKKSHAQA